jgi:hypothetical protein
MRKQQIAPKEIKIGPFWMLFQGQSLQDFDLGPTDPEWSEPFQFQYEGKLWSGSPSKLDISRGVALFWFAHDLFWTALALESNKNTTQLRRGLVMAAWQMEQAGLSDHFFYRRLKRAVEDSDKGTDYWTDSRRHKMAVDLVRSAQEIGEHLNAHVKEHGPKGTYMPLPPRPSNQRILASFM